jgi:type I restriction enzyme M protein
MAKKSSATLSSLSIEDEIRRKLKKTKEQEQVVGPLVLFLTTLGWGLDQMIFGKKEWRVPKTPSEASKREKGGSYDGYPCDIVVFDSPKHVGNFRHILVIIECKQPTEEKGVNQLEIYLSNEPHAKLGVWANNADKSAPAIFLYRTDGKVITKRRSVADLPRAGEKISPKAQKLAFADLSVPSAQVLKRTIEDLLDKVVMIDSRVTRREEQLDQLCNLLLLKLESDKQAKVAQSEPPFFVLLNLLIKLPKSSANGSHHL